MRARRHIFTAVLLCIAAMTACTAPSEVPTLEAATQRLNTDAGSLAGTADLRLSAVEQADDGSCVPGQVRRFLRAETAHAEASTGLLDRLQAMGYHKVVDDLDFRDDEQDVAVLRNPETELTFELTVLSGDRPTVQVVGKTTCYVTE
ncbi:hypothetical protein SAMN05444920_10852 [Nonomuraea solani]|uniref:Lipoprotein n=1 Tax=Nonomuraea solani TaxID=1144553 RepID=A0A1H6E5W5_9ACTN|nr:hypothetical protein [Nonomuraea solani]SEG93168.1 hypothetical protein SAMN05444920_10852 [Nonomuraea solani]